MLSGGTYPRLLILASWISVFALAGGCGGGGDDAGPSGGTDTETGGTGDSPGSGGNDASGGRSSSNGGTKPGGETGGTTAEGGAAPEPEGGAPPVTVSPDPDFEGIDPTEVPLEATPGCEGGFNPESGALSLDVEETSHFLLVDAFEGNVRANGQICSAEDGTPALAEALKKLTIVGSDDADRVILDMLDGAFNPELLAGEDALHVDLGAGTDSFSIRATREDDQVTCDGGPSPTRNLVTFGKADAAALTLDHAESLLVSLGPGNDAFLGYASDHPCTLHIVAFGGDGMDLLQGGTQNDVLNGGEGSDEFEMGPFRDGADLINGGDGDDLVSYAQRRSDLRLKLCSAPDLTGCAEETCKCEALNGETAEADRLVNIEDADGGDGDDIIIGDENPNVLVGRGGADRIDGMGGTDQIYGELGDDTINGGAGDDILIGAQGKNFVDGALGDDICFFAPGDKPLANCETRIDSL